MTRVKVNREFYRSLEPDNYRADYSKAQKTLGWSPKTSFMDLVKIIVKNDILSSDDNK